MLFDSVKTTVRVKGRGISGVLFILPQSTLFLAGYARHGGRKKNKRMSKMNEEAITAMVISFWNGFSTAFYVVFFVRWGKWVNERRKSNPNGEGAPHFVVRLVYLVLGFVGAASSALLAGAYNRQSGYDLVNWIAIFGMIIGIGAALHMREQQLTKHSPEAMK